MQIPFPALLQKPSQRLSAKLRHSGCKQIFKGVQDQACVFRISTKRKERSLLTSNKKVPGERKVDETGLTALPSFKGLANFEEDRRTPAGFVVEEATETGVEWCRDAP